MTKCTESGCRSLEWKCADCGRVASTANYGWTYSGDFSKTEHFRGNLENMSEWISVKDSPVPREYPILVWGPCMAFPISIYWKEEGTYGEPGFFEEGDEHQMKEENISHWMPLPPIDFITRDARKLGPLGPR